MVVYQREKAKLLVYTRKVSHRDYPDGLARSVHLAISRDGEHWQAMHGNYGILFAEAELSGEGESGMLQLLPGIHKSDGFFLARLVRDN